MLIVSALVIVVTVVGVVAVGAGPLLRDDDGADHSGVLGDAATRTAVVVGVAVAVVAVVVALNVLVIVVLR